jgi:hypothetical protein
MTPERSRPDTIARRMRRRRLADLKVNLVLLALVLIGGGVWIMDVTVLVMGLAVGAVLAIWIAGAPSTKDRL